MTHLEPTPPSAPTAPFAPITLSAPTTPSAPFHPPPPPPGPEGAGTLCCSRPERPRWPSPRRGGFSSYLRCVQRGVSGRARCSERNFGGRDSGMNKLFVYAIASRNFFCVCVCNCGVLGVAVCVGFSFCLFRSYWGRKDDWII